MDSKSVFLRSCCPVLAPLALLLVLILLFGGTEESVAAFFDYCRAAAPDLKRAAAFFTKYGSIPFYVLWTVILATAIRKHDRRGILLVGFYRPPEESPEAGRPGGVARNVILMIGDGMGPAPLFYTSLRAVGKAGRLHIETMPYTGLVKTYPDESVVTADHDTGGLILSPSGRYVKEHWGTRGHTAIPVPVFAYGPGAEAFSGVMHNYQLHDRIAAAIGE